MARRSIVKDAGVVAGISVLSKFLGFAREASLAAVFGATYHTDAYVVGQTIPGIVFAALGAALGITFIPVYAHARKTRGKEAALDMVNTVTNAIIILSIALIALGELLAGPLTRLVAPGFRGPALDLTVALTRIMFPMMLFQALSGLYTGMLQSEGDFISSPAVSLVFNVITISSIMGLGPKYGIKAVAWATTAAVAAQPLLLLPALRKIGYRWKPFLDTKDPGLLRILQLVGPVLIGVSVQQLNVTIDRMLASGLSSGSVAALSYGYRLASVMPVVVGTAITTVMYPALAKLSAEGSWERFTDGLLDAIGVITLILVPIGVGMAVLRTPIVRLVFERGAFDAAATSVTSWVFLFYALAMPLYTLREMTAKAFFSIQDTWAPMLTTAQAVVVNIVLNLALIRPLQQGGLALATALAQAFSVATLLWKLRDRVRRRGVLSDTGFRKFLGSACLITLASVLMGGVTWVVHYQLAQAIPGKAILAQVIRLSGSVMAGALCYSLLVVAFKVPVANLAIRTALDFLNRRGRRTLDACAAGTED